ncbi:MAG: KamA family radical SAM protein [Spirochaetaceae bacterium]|nr:MAG: KamA family radical SAM protein [Spirochaetaceae bacterium]
MEERLLPQEDDEPPGSSAAGTATIKKNESNQSSEQYEQHINTSFDNITDNCDTRVSLRTEIIDGHIRFSQKAEQKCSPHVQEFRDKFYPEVSDADWNNWRWQIRHRVRRFEELSRILDLSDDEYRTAFFNACALPVAITPYYASLLDPAYNTDQALRRTVVPVSDEFIRSPGEEMDPLGEDDDSPVPGLVHRYPDRVLFLVTKFCSTNCRYCTRSRMIMPNEKYPFSMKHWEQAIEYIRKTPQIRDVLLSGGDPLTLADEKLEWLLKQLRAIPHVEFIRIGTKVPMVLPQRVSKSLCNMLKKYHPLWMSIHCTHPDELTEESARACNMLADAGIPLGSQTVLLKGINDNVDTMKRLVHGLLKNRVRPYYLYQCDPIKGSRHFRTPVQKGLEMIQGLRGHTTGYGVPTYVIDAPGGGGKIPLLPEYVQGHDNEGNLVLKNFKGNLYKYPDCGIPNA